MRCPTCITEFKREVKSELKREVKSFNQHGGRTWYPMFKWKGHY
jgi:hypothetical protein